MPSKNRKRGRKKPKASLSSILAATAAAEASKIEAEAAKYTQGQSSSAEQCTASVDGREEEYESAVAQHRARLEAQLREAGAAEALSSSRSVNPALKYAPVRSEVPIEDCPKNCKCGLCFRWDVEAYRSELIRSVGGDPTKRCGDPNCTCGVSPDILAQAHMLRVYRSELNWRAAVWPGCQSSCV